MSREKPLKTALQIHLVFWLLSFSVVVATEPNVAPAKVRFFEARIRPVLVKQRVPLGYLEPVGNWSRVGFDGDGRPS